MCYHRVAHGEPARERLGRLSYRLLCSNTLWSSSVFYQNAAFLLTIKYQCRDFSLPKMGNDTPKLGNTPTLTKFNFFDRKHM